MKTRIWISSYELRVRTSAVVVNRAPPTRSGALLRIETEPGIIGYADVHPWAELGDEPLQTQLSKLSGGKLTPLTRNSLLFAKLDAGARAQKKSLWEGVTIPRCHFIAGGGPGTGDPDTYSPKAIEDAIASGFDRIKIKLGKDPARAAETLKKLVPLVAGKAKLRLDFNSKLDPKGYARFLAAIGPMAAEIDFIEDPTPWDLNTGFDVDAKTVRLAVDRESARAIESSFCPPVLIVKPAVQEWETLPAKILKAGKQCVFTSYLDHPVGQLFGAWAAAKTGAATAGSHGFLSHTVYEPTAFTELLQNKGPILSPPPGTGIGFDEVLRKRQWVLLTGEAPKK